MSDKDTSAAMGARTSTISSTTTSSNSPSKTNDLSLVSKVSKIAANLLFTIIAVTPILLPISVIGGKKLTKRLNK
jgi:hypothetical protein